MAGIDQKEVQLNYMISKSYTRSKVNAFTYKDITGA